MDNCCQIYTLLLAWTGVCQNPNNTTCNNPQHPHPASWPNIYCCYLEALSISTSWSSPSPKCTLQSIFFVRHFYLLGPLFSQLHTFKSGNWVRTGWMNKLWVSFPLSWCMPSGSKDSCPRLTTPGAVPVIRGHGTRGSSGTLDKDLICKGHLLEGWMKNAEVFVCEQWTPLAMWKYFEGPFAFECRTLNSKEGFWGLISWKDI